MRNILFFISFLYLQITVAQSYDAYFTKEALRLDFFLFGTKRTTQVALKGLKQEPPRCFLKKFMKWVEL